MIDNPVTDIDARDCFLREIAATHGQGVYYWYERVRRHSPQSLIELELWDNQENQNEKVSNNVSP